MSVGEALAEARHQAGLSVAQVSQQTRIREAIICGIENEDYSACGSDFYARGHIRGIAKVTGVDPEPLIREYDTAHLAPQMLTLADIFPDIPDIPATPARTRGQPRLTRTLALTALAACLLALGVTASGLLSGSRPTATAPPQARARPAARPRAGPDRRVNAAVPARPPARPRTLTPASAAALRPPALPPVSAAAARPPDGHDSLLQARPAGYRPQSHPARASQPVHHRPPQGANGGHRPAPGRRPPRADRGHADHARVSAAHRNRARPGRHAAHRIRGPRGAAAV